MTSLRPLLLHTIQHEAATLTPDQHAASMRFIEALVGWPVGEAQAPPADETKTPSSPLRAYLEWETEQMLAIREAHFTWLRLCAERHMAWQVVHTIPTADGTRTLILEQLFMDKVLPHWRDDAATVVVDRLTQALPTLVEQCAAKHGFNVKTLESGWEVRL